MAVPSAESLLSEFCVYSCEVKDILARTLLGRIGRRLGIIDILSVFVLVYERFVVLQFLMYTLVFF